MAPPSSDDLLALARGFQESRVLLTAAELDLFTLLAHKSLSAAQIADEKRLALRPLTMLLDALVAMELLAKHQQTYSCTTTAVECLSASSSQSVRPMLLHATKLWDTWSNLTSLVCGKDAQSLPQVDDTAAFIGAMHVVGRARAASIVAAVRPGAARRLLDVGGASGTYTMAFLDAAPELQATLFDLPEVIELARARLLETGYLARVRLVAGDFTTDALPAGHDLAYLGAIIHSLSLEQNQALYENVFQALTPGGRIVIRDHVMSPDRTEPRAGALFAINMLVNTEDGGTFTFDEIATGLKRAGFERIRLLQPGELMNALVEGFKPQLQSVG